MKRVALAALLVALGVLGPAVARAAEDPATAPSTTTTGDGRTTTDGRRTLTVSKARDLESAAQSITVDGAGYDNTKGIYVAFCVIPASPQQSPGPCGGGQDRTGQNGGAVWVSSNPPLYARGLTTPYGKGGTFRVSINVQAQLNENTDCRVVRCAVTTRNDHTRSSDRSQDILVPVYFQGGFGPPAAGAPNAPATTPSTSAPRAGRGATTTTLVEALAAPLTTVSDDRRSVTDGTKTLRATKTNALVTGAEVEVSGSGYDESKGIYVSLCFISETLAPGPCASGSAGQSAWISSNPPAYGAELATPYETGGVFAVTLALDPVIDAEHDCTKVACALSTRNDDTHPGDRSQDLLLPVSFAADTRVPPLDIDRSVDNGSKRTVPLVGGLVFVGACGAAGVYFAQKKKRTA
ncbi:MAG TPA: hypothetical protein VMZ22_06930 [Acidimicrobiales bacterium]|nr:hypothetical protein [Acidimicrobiales bacterium]